MCREGEEKHKHHIIPRYRGGSNTQENLVEVTITQHSMYHYCNYLLWGREEDNIAWRALSGQITMSEAKIEARRMGSKNATKAFKEKLKNPEKLKEHKQKCREAQLNSINRQANVTRCRKIQPLAVEASLKPESRQKRKNTLNEIKHQQGEKNSQYGKIWITNGTKEGSYRINKDQPIPEGFRLGRVCYDSNEHIEKCFAKYIYTIITPENKIVIIKNLKKYCNDNELDLKSMWCVSVGKLKAYKNYRVTREAIIKENQTTIDNPPPSVLC